MRPTVRRLLQLSKGWSADSVTDNPLKPLFHFDVISESGLPVPNPALLLHPLSGLLPFPAYFPQLYDLVHELKVNETEMALLQLSDESQNDRITRLRQLSKDKVILVSKLVLKVLAKTNQGFLSLI